MDHAVTTHTKPTPEYNAKTLANPEQPATLSTAKQEAGDHRERGCIVEPRRRRMLDAGKTKPLGFYSSSIRKPEREQ